MSAKQKYGQNKSKLFARNRVSTKIPGNDDSDLMFGTKAFLLCDCKNFIEQKGSHPSNGPFKLASFCFTVVFGYHLAKSLGQNDRSWSADARTDAFRTCFAQKIR